MGNCRHRHVASFAEWRDVFSRLGEIRGTAEPASLEIGVRVWGSCLGADRARGAGSGAITICLK